MRTHERFHSASMNGSLSRKLAIVVTLVIGAIVAPSGRAEAQAASEPVDPGVRCAAKVGTGQYEFYLPGERATDVNGNKWVCGPDGQWFRDYSSALTKASLTGLSVPSYSLVALPRLSFYMR